MTDGSASKNSSVKGLLRTAAQSSWRDDARRSTAARFGAMRDFVRDRRWTAAIAVAVVALSGAGVVAGVGGSTERSEALEKTVAQREKQVADLDAERKRREDQLAELQKRLNAKESQIAEAEDRSSELEKRREALQRQVAELVAPVAPGTTERVADGDMRQAPERTAAASSSSDEADMPPDETADVSSAAVDDPETEDAETRPTARPERVSASSRMSEASSRAERDDALSPSAAPVRVFIHVRSADPAARERAAAVAAELRRRGVSSVQIRGVRLPVARDSVRFFYDQDRTAVPELQDAIRSVAPRGGSEPVVNDFRSYGAPPRRGTIELWLS